MLFWGDYYLRWWRLPIEERACRKIDLGGGDYYLRNSGLPPSSEAVPSINYIGRQLDVSYIGRQVMLIRYTAHPTYCNI